MIILLLIEIIKQVKNYRFTYYYLFRKDQNFKTLMYEIQKKIMNKNTKETVQTFLTLNETNIYQKNNLVHKKKG